MIFENGIFAYKNILIDTDLEPDDKAALDVFFKALHFYSQQNPSYSYPTITIIAGSSDTPEKKAKQANIIIHNLKKQGYIPSLDKIKVVQGSGTTKSHERDGEELFETNEEFLINAEPVDTNPIEAITTFLQNSDNEESVYVALREVKDLKTACEQFQNEFNNVDFMGTLSFNVAAVYREQGNQFVYDILTKFRNALCYENFHSACKHNTTAKIWSDSFGEYLCSNEGELLKKASIIWDDSNIPHCAGGIIQACKYNRDVRDLISWTIEDFKEDCLTKTEVEFRKELAEVLGSGELEKNISLQYNLARFCSMVFYRPQICLADVAFLGIVSNPAILKDAIKPKDICYSGNRSQLSDNPESSIQYVIMNEQQLKFLGEKVTEILSTPAFKKEDILQSTPVMTNAFQNSIKKQSGDTPIATMSEETKNVPSLHY